jgi:hypothetical protein
MRRPQALQALKETIGTLVEDAKVNTIHAYIIISWVFWFWAHGELLKIGDVLSSPSWWGRLWALLMLLHPLPWIWISSWPLQSSVVSYFGGNSK